MSPAREGVWSAENQIFDEYSHEQKWTQNEELARIVATTESVPTTSMVPDNIGKEQTADNDTGGRTEWEDALIKKGIMEKPIILPTEDELQLKDLEAYQAKDPLQNKTLQELNELEDDIDEDILNKLRNKRIEELKLEKARNIFGDYNEIGETEFVQEVTEASKKHTVIIHLYVNSKLACDIIHKNLEILAKKHAYIKFLKIKSIRAIPYYPDNKCPTILIYKDGDISEQFIGLEHWGGKYTTANTIEYRLKKYLTKCEFQEDPLVTNAKKQIINGYLPTKMNINRNDYIGLPNKHANVIENEISDTEFDDLSDF